LNIDIFNIDLNGNISDWENDPVYNSIIELMNWGQGCANVDACNYDQISNYDNEACWFKNDGCECSDGENALLSNDGICSILSLYDGLIQDEYKIHRIYPNPFNPIANISYELTNSSVVKLIVYNLYGTQIATLVNNFQNSGFYTIKWDASFYSSGVYLIRLESGEFIQTQKVVLIK